MSSSNQSKYGSWKVHLILLFLTAGFGNLAYALYARSTYTPNQVQQLDKSDVPDTSDEDSNDSVVRASGSNGQIAVDENKVVISRDGVIASGAHGLTKGDKEIWLNSITGIEFEEPGVTNGYIQIHQSGNTEESHGMLDRTDDDNTVHFRRKYTEDFRQIKQTIEQRANQ